MKKIAQAAMAGVRIAAVVFLIYCIVFGLIGGEETFASGYGIARSGLDAVIIGIGFGIPAVVYETKLKMWLKVLIHMGIGCTVMIGASFLRVGLPTQKGMLATLAVVTIQVISAFVIWAIRFIPMMIQAKKMNQKIKEKQQDE